MSKTKSQKTYTSFEEFEEDLNINTIRLKDQTLFLFLVCLFPFLGSIYYPGLIVFVIGVVFYHLWDTKKTIDRIQESGLNAIKREEI